MDYVSKKILRNALFNGEQNLYSWAEIEAKIDAIPAADVRPVVLCKDCLSYDKANRLCILFFHEMYEDDFCSRRAPRL